VDKPVIFTEIGYRSGNGSSIVPGRHWGQLSVDLQEQADCYEAAFQVLWNKTWFYGFYWWNWETDPNAGGSADAGYTPQDKMAQDVVTNWYSLERRVIVLDQAFVTSEKCLVNENQTVGFHVSWEHNETSVIGATIQVSGVKHVTNTTGWASFAVSYDTVGERLWVVSDVEHSEASCYKKTVSDPCIVWDRPEIAEIDVDTTDLGVLKVTMKGIYAYEKTPVRGATAVVDGVLCDEVEPGVYECEESTWSPVQTVTVQLGTSTKTLLTAHTINTVFYTTLFITGTLAIVLLKYVYSGSFVKKSQKDSS